MTKQPKVRKPHPVLHGIGLGLSVVLLVAVLVGTYVLSTMATIIDSFTGGEMAFETGSNSYLQALRRATKEALYMYLHVRVTNRDYADSIGDTTAVRHAFTTSVFGWRHLVALIDIVAVVLFALAVRGVVIDVKLRKAAKTEKKNF